MRPLITLLLLLAAATTLHAQSYLIKGTVSDTASDNTLPNACITLLRAKDSVMESFARAKDDGTFELHARSKGKYIFMTTFPGLADYIDYIDIKDEKPIDLGTIPMISRVHLLKEFVMTKEYAAIKVKGDTIEYVADSFKTRDNATVEALLKKLPGIQVDKNGQIIAQGEKVEKVLVDGEEFFTDDPAVVTKSLQAKAVDKVQVYDKKSDQAEFTGIDDGEKIKTINLQLKDDKKKGFFGKVVAGGGAGDERGYFENQAMINSFKGKRQLSAFGIASNTGKIGLGWEDKDKYGASNTNSTMTDDGSYVTYYSNDDDDFSSWDGQYNGQGIPKAYTGGLHFADKWNREKEHLASNYRYAKQDITTTTNTITQYTLPDSTYYTKQNQNVYKTGQRHRVDGLFDWKLDSTSSIKLTANSGYSNTQTTSDFDAQTLSGSDQLINSSNRRVTNDATTKSINSTLDYRKKFKKEGRTVSFNLTEYYRETEGDGHLNNTTSVKDTTVAGQFLTLTTDQKKITNTKALNLSSRISYTEPLVAKKVFLELNYSFKLDNNNSVHETYNKAAPDKAYDILDSIYTNKYQYNVMTHNGGTNFRFVFKKINFSAGASASYANFEQKDLMLDTSRKRDFVNFFPAANFTYKFSKQTRISFNYYGSTNQPTIDQIQPFRNNLDPLNIAIGNSALKQEFKQRVSVSFNDYKMLSGRYIWSSLSFNTSNNAISRSDNTDALGRHTYQYVNVNGNYSAWGYFSYGAKIKKTVNAGGYVNLGLNHINNYINGVKNVSDNNTYTVGLRADYTTSNEKFSVSLNPSVTYNDNKATISTYTTSFWNTSTEFEISYELPLNFEIGTDFNWYVREQTTVFDQNNNVFKWNAYVSKKFLKNKQLELRMSAFDILNQNLGFTRYAQNNYVTQDNYNTIRRYGMISLTWNFTKSAAGVPQNDAAQIIQSVK